MDPTGSVFRRMRRLGVGVLLAGSLIQPARPLDGTASSPTRQLRVPHHRLYHLGDVIEIGEILGLDATGTGTLATVGLRYNMLRSTLEVDWLFDGTVIGHSTLPRGLDKGVSFPFDRTLPGEVAARLRGGQGDIQILSVSATLHPAASAVAPRAPASHAVSAPAVAPSIRAEPQPWGPVVEAHGAPRPEAVVENPRCCSASCGSPWQWDPTVSVEDGEQFGESRRFTVPSGKLLVVEFVSFSGLVPSHQHVRNLTVRLFRQGSKSVSHSHWLKLWPSFVEGDLSGFVGSQTLRMYAEAGDALSVWMARSGTGGAGHVSLSLTGRLVPVD